MHYLRMLTNAGAGGVLVATYLFVLVMQLNPQVPIVSETAGGWFVALLSLYGPLLGFALFFLLVARELLGSFPLRPGWLSLRLLAWLGGLGAAGAAAVTWANLDAYAAVLTTQAAERMRQGAVVTTASAAVLLVIALLRYSFGRRGTRPMGVLLTATLIGSLAAPLGLRGPGELAVPADRRARSERQAGPGPRVRLLLLDGASLGLIRQRVAVGRLPAFARLLDQGATIDLETLRPTQAETVWAAAATGKLPPKNGVRSASVFEVGLDEPDPVSLLPNYVFAQALERQQFVRASGVTAAALTARPLWAILADQGLASGIVGWPLTYPARTDRGYIVSDRFDESASSPLRLDDANAAEPTNAIAAARDAFDVWLARPWQDVLPPVSPDEAEPAGLITARWDRAFADTAARLEGQFSPRLTALRVEGLAAFGHAHLRAAQPALFGQVRSEGPQPPVLDRYYARVDDMVALEASRLSPGDLLIVVSAFGMVPTPLPSRVLARLFGLPTDTGTHESAPDGFLIAYGTNVATGSFARGAIVDLAPTVLYYLGLRVGRDMDGFARTDLFLPTFTRDRPVTYVATHER